MPTAGIWTESFPVRSYDVTPHGTASILALCEYIQDAAGHHAASLGLSMQDLLADGRAWVLARLRLEVDRLPDWDAEVVVETWPSGLERLFATREIVLHDDDGTFARGTSAWLVIDTERRRPMRPPAMLKNLQTPDRSAPFSHDMTTLPGPDAVDHERTFAVRYHDLDLNRHVNNVRYVEWALETLPPAVHDAYRCAGLELQFRAETTLGDPVRAVAQTEADGDALRVRHRLDHADDGHTLALATTQWVRTGDAD